MSRNRTHGGQPVIAVLAMIVVALAACGDNAEVGGDDASTGDSPTSTSDASSQPGTNAAESGGDEASPDADAGAGEHHGTVTIGSDSYRFRVDENGQCDPDFLGQGIFRALMHQIDDEGTSVPLGDGNGRGNLTLSVVIDEDLDSPDAQSLMNVRTADNWMAMVSVAGSRIDSVTIDGNRASGTATFVNEAGDQTQAGSFDIVCANS